MHSLRGEEDFVKTARVGLTLGLCAVAFVAQARRQARKAGLWEITTTVSLSGMRNMNMGPWGPDTICVPQAMIDKYGGPYENADQGQCALTNVVLTARGMTAKLTCPQTSLTTGTAQTTFVDANTTKTTIQMTTYYPIDHNEAPLNTTIQTTATYKGPDCGSVKPLAMPASQ